MKPNSHTYLSLINVNIVACKPQWAMYLLEHMMVMYKGNVTCNSSCKFDSRAKLQQVFLCIKVNDDNCSVLPNLQSFCSILSACTYVSPKGDGTKALLVAINTFKTLHSSKHFHQNSFIYEIVFKACTN